MQFDVYMRTNAYFHVNVETDNPDEAEGLALPKIGSGYFKFVSTEEEADGHIDDDCLSLEITDLVPKYTDTEGIKKFIVTCRGTAWINLTEPVIVNSIRDILNLSQEELVSRIDWSFMNKLNNVVIRDDVIDIFEVQKFAPDRYRVSCVFPVSIDFEIEAKSKEDARTIFNFSKDNYELNMPDFGKAHLNEGGLTIVEITEEGTDGKEKV